VLPTVGEHDRGRAHEPRGPPIGRDVGQRRDELGVVGAVVGRLARVPGAEDPGRPVERVDLQARIVGHRWQAGRPGARSGLQQRVGLEGVAVLDGLGQAVLAHRHQLHVEPGEDRRISPSLCGLPVATTTRVTIGPPGRRRLAAAA
jgi:hypothetical protein